MTELQKLASRYQSLRVARDVLAGRKVDGEQWWWWDPALGLERLELERAQQAHAQSDAVQKDYLK